MGSPHTQMAPGSVEPSLRECPANSWVRPCCKHTSDKREDHRTYNQTGLNRMIVDHQVREAGETHDEAQDTEAHTQAGIHGVALVSHRSVVGYFLHFLVTERQELDTGQIDNCLLFGRWIVSKQSGGSSRDPSASSERCDRGEAVEPG
jgi:hypothetical protein